MAVQITLKAARVNKGMTQKEVSEALGVCWGALHNWETGKVSPPATAFMQMCSMYDVSPGDIFLPTK